MASIPVVLQQLRRARRERTREPPEGRFEEYRPSYEESLEAARDLAGEDTLDAVAEWAVEWTTRERRLPDPETFRANTRRILLGEGIEVPPDSPLADS